METNGNNSNSDPDMDMQDIFRRHFEAQFKPLPKRKQPAESVSSRPPQPLPEADESEWNGLSESDGMSVTDVGVECTD